MSVQPNISNHEKLYDNSKTAGFEALCPALVEIFGIIGVGYISGR